MPLTTDVYANPANFQAKSVLCNPDGASGELTFNLYAHTLTEVGNRDNARITISSSALSLVPINLVAEAGTTILDPSTLTPVVSLTIVLGGDSVELVFYSGTDQWVIKQKPSLNYFEIWQATPIAPVTSNVIQWTNLDVLGFGDSIFSYAAGVFTSILKKSQLIETHLKIQTEAVLANNEDTIYSYAPSFSGIGINSNTPIQDFAQSSRADTFPKAGETTGAAITDLGDTLSWTATAVGSGTCNIVQGYVTFKLEAS